ncbi:hypothetical protein O181_003308 [Austropuccinia psidii MF-1]|uniref:Uncharacterized protein n=1 Tax=Austropuccinia psidii MF-1 TaxID=1389203 RepID=A0A9Q3BE82_9BASI|nr:hypothetical protein [Austropuccinia psidii MF-1]
MSETMEHKSISRECGGDLEHAIRIKGIEPSSTEDYIKSMENITTRTTIGRNWYEYQTDNKTSGKPISREKSKKQKNRAPFKCHKYGISSHLTNTFPDETRFKDIKLENT